MDDKKTQIRNEPVSKVRVFHFLEEIKSEFKKVTWTSKEELKVYTKVVIAFTFVFGMAVYFTDVIIHQSLEILNAVFRLIIG